MNAKCVMSLRIQLTLIDSLKSLSRNNIQFRLWKEKTQQVLDGVFGEKAELSEEFRKIRYRRRENEDPGKCNYYLRGLEKAEQILEQALTDIDVQEECSSEDIQKNWPHFRRQLQEMMDKSKLSEEEKDEILRELVIFKEKMRKTGKNELDLENYSNRIAKILNRILDNM